MDESIGQALRAARLKKNLSVEDVSIATKMRPERIKDLERDDYTRFPNLTYARNFLILYSKYLRLDISKYPTIEVGSTVGLSDYQYLRSEEKETAKRSIPEQAGPPEKPRWLIVFFVFLIMLALGALIGWGVMNFRRLGPVENLGKKDAEALTLPMPQAPTPKPAETPAPTPAVVPSPSPDAVAVPPENIPVLPAQPATATASPSPEPEVRRAEPIAAATPDASLLTGPVPPAATPSPSPTTAFPPLGEVREIKVHATKKIRVRIAHDKPNASSDYLGSMNPAMTSRSFRGKYFWIKTTDPDALQVTIDGKPATGSDSGVEIERVPGL